MDRKPSSRPTTRVRRLAAFAALFVLFATSAADWPQWRGPNRNGISTETGLLKQWPKDGPKLLWQVKDLGGGYSTPSVVGDRLYLVTNKGLEEEFVKALDVKDGKEIWSTPIGKVGNPKQQPPYPGARSTPTVQGDVLYALSSDGDLASLETATGKVRWRKSLRTDLGGKPGIWAYSESPLVDGDAVVCTPGGNEATLAALNKNTGDVIWKCPVPGGGTAAYASAIVVETGGVRQYVQLLQKGLVGVEAATGNFLWRFDKPISKFDANIPTPVAGDGIVYAGSAGTGGGAVKLTARDGKVQAEQLYFDAAYPAAIGGAVKLGNFLYGTNPKGLVCLEFDTGKVRWQSGTGGAASLCFADGRLYLHGENGDVALVEPSPEAYHEKGRFAPPEQPKHTMRGEMAWAYPVVANGRLYVHDLNCLWCYDVREQAAGR
jgi:outer membrane protein assembly factor BamB